MRLVWMRLTDEQREDVSRLNKWQGSTAGVLHGRLQFNRREVSTEEGEKQLYYTGHATEVMLCQMLCTVLPHTCLYAMAYSDWAILHLL